MDGFFSEKDCERLRMLLEDRGKKMLLYHSDPDGICAAAMIKKCFTNIESVPRKGPGFTEEFLEAVTRKKPDILIAVDLPIDQEAKAIARLRKEIPGLRVSIIDHHIYERNMNPGILHINPRFAKKDAYIPAACVVYRMLEKMGLEVKPMLWMAAAGVIGDMGMKDCKKLLGQAKKEFPYLFRKGFLDSEIMNAVETISATVTMKGLKGAGMCIKALRDSDGFEDFVRNEKLSGLRKDFHEEFAYVAGGFEKERQEHTKRIWSYEIKSAYSITSIVANHFGSELPDRIIIIRKANPQGWKFSVRGQNMKVNLGDLVKKSIKGIGSGGGHERAAAGITTDWDKFMERFVKNAKKASFS